MNTLSKIAERAGKLTEQDWEGIVEDRRRILFVGLYAIPFEELGSVLLEFRPPGPIGLHVTTLNKLYSEWSVRGEDGTTLKTRGLFWQEIPGATHAADNETTKETFLWGLNKKGDWIRVALQANYSEEGMTSMFVSTHQETLQSLLAQVNVKPIQICRLLKGAVEKFHEKRRIQFHAVETINLLVSEQDSIIRALCETYDQTH